MDLFWKTVGGMLIVAILSLALGRDMGVLLCLAGCSMGAIIALEFLEPVIDLLRQLEAMADLEGGMLGILLKVAGIALLSELAAMICADSGNGSLGKVIHILGNAAILWVSTPMFQSVLNILQQIVGAL